MHTLEFMMSSKKIKYLGINLAKDIKYLYSEIFKSLKKEADEINKRMGRSSIITGW